MNTKKLLWWLLLLFGEVLIISAFILFGGNLSDNILILNIIVSSLVYLLFFGGYRAPWIDLKDKSQKQIGSLGVSWKVIWFYSFFAITAMIMCNIALSFPFLVQLIIHGVLLFFLLLGVYLSIQSSDKVKDVYIQETANRSGINEMKTAVRRMKDRMNEVADLPEEFINRINTLEENLRFISPSDNEDAHDLEHSFSQTISDITFSISNFSMNKETIESNLKKLERIYQNRKQIYSN